MIFQKDDILPMVWRIIGSSIENLLKAWREFKKGKTKKKDILEFDFYLEENIFKLHNELKNKTYKNEPYVPFYVYDPKRRHVHKIIIF